MPLHPQARTVADLLAALGGAPLSELPVADARAGYALLNPAGSEPVHHIADLDAGGVPVRLYRPSAEENLPLLVFFHGGGWVIGNLDTHDAVCRSLANRSGAAVVSVDYRLAPEHRFPAAVEDCEAALAWAHANAASLGADPSRIAVGGDSAGGNLAAVVAQRTTVPLLLQLLVYPVTDASMSMPSIDENAAGPLLTKATMAWFLDHYLSGAGDAADPRVSPLRADAATLARTPPALVITAEFDPLRDEGEAYGRALVEAGVNASVMRFFGQFHAFFNMLGALDDAALAHDAAATALRRAFALS